MMHLLDLSGSLRENALTTAAAEPLRPLLAALVAWNRRLSGSR